jgi:hypothetical protein
MRGNITEIVGRRLRVRLPFRRPLAKASLCIPSLGKTGGAVSLVKIERARVQSVSGPSNVLRLRLRTGLTCSEFHAQGFASTAKDVTARQHLASVDGRTRNTPHGDDCQEVQAARRGPRHATQTVDGAPPRSSPSLNVAKLFTAESFGLLALASNRTHQKCFHQAPPDRRFLFSAMFR